MRKKLFIALLFLLGALVLSYTPVHAQDDEMASAITCIPVVNEQSVQNIEFAIEPGENFVENQAIISGTQDDVDIVLQSIPQIWEVQVLRILSPEQFRFLGNQTIVLIHTQAGNANTYPFVTAIYATIAELIRERKIQNAVYVDLNYIVDRDESRADPHSVGAHPFGAISAGASTFNQQWAFTTAVPHSIGLWTGTPVLRTIAAEGSQQTHVAIFDTSPYPEPGLKTVGIDVPGEVDAEVMNLCVSYPSPSLTLMSHPDDHAPIDVSSHGLFVAGLVHAVAPGVSLDLIRALNEQGEGHLFWLLEALTLYLNDAISNRGTLIGTVINLSLGVHSPPTTTLPIELLDQVNNFLGSISSPSLSTSVLPVFVLEQLLSTAYQGGAVIVASAGNGVAPTAMQTPASYSSVIGVAATDKDGFRSCFSNFGDIGAPGGNGGVPGCDPMVISDTTQCNASSCPYALISVVLTDTTPGSEQYAYAYWLGTSFSAPLGSGIAALTHEQIASWHFPPYIHAFLVKFSIEDLACLPPLPTSGTPGLGSGLLNVKAIVGGLVTACPP